MFRLQHPSSRSTFVLLTSTTLEKHQLTKPHHTNLKTIITSTKCHAPKLSSELSSNDDIDWCSKWGVRRDLMPKHVTIILDGNRRWHKQHGKPIGYVPFFEANLVFANLCLKFGIPTASTFIYGIQTCRRGKLYNILLPPSHQAEIDSAANVANWLSSNLNKANPGEPSVHLLPDHVTANFSNFIVSGHSRGGKTAYALALGLTETITLEPKISALIALDPVAGFSILSIKFPTKPNILTYVNNSIDLTIPTMIIGCGLGGSCAPRGLNHDEFYKESKKGSQFVLADYGHCDMLNDDAFATLGRILCGTVKRGSYDSMRRTIGGLVVAFIDAYFGSRPEEYKDILSHPSVAPVKLYPVEDKGQPLPYYDAQA